jgi:hypothetical protein
MLLIFGIPNGVSFVDAGSGRLTLHSAVSFGVVEVIWHSEVGVLLAFTLEINFLLLSLVIASF